MSPLASYLEALAGAERPSRYLGDEVGLPPPGTGSRLRVVMAFPDVYEVGMSHLGFRLLHATLAARWSEGLQVERVFLPWPDLQARLAQLDVPLCSLESGTPVADADLLGVSVQYELALPGVLKLLDLARIPRRVSERGSGRWPVVLVGGVGALNPEPLVPFVDCFFVGEADQAIGELVDGLAETRHAPRRAQLERLARIEGVYVPELGGGVRRRYLEDLDQLELPGVHLVPTCEVVHDRVAVEIQRGCCRGCRFCQAGYAARPTRQRTAGRILEAARAQLAATGYEDLSLLSLSAGDHPCLQELLAALIREHGPRRVSISLPSMRTDSLHPEVARHISSVRKTTFTLAPEAATERLRRVINKGNTEEDLMASVEAVARAGYSQFKLYFMIGLPTETDKDVLAIAELSKRVLQQVQRHGVQHAALTVSVSTFVPKPHTPFQWEPAPDLPEIQRKQQLLVRNVPRRIRLKWHDPGQSLVEAYLARADRRMAAVLDRLVTPEHMGLDAWTEHFSLERWEQALAGGPSPAELLAGREPSAPLPWDHVDVGVTRAYLLAQRQAALAAQTRPDCSDGACGACGVCPEEPLHRLAPREALAAAAVPGGGPETATAPGGPPTVVRLWFQKTGKAALISHLEMAGVFERAARRAGLALAFSSGMRPKPKLRFAPALPLGAESRCEFAELGLAQALRPEEVRDALAAELPPGLVLDRAEPADDNLLKRIRGIRWQLELDRPAEAALSRARARLAQGPLRVPRRRGRTVDLTALVLELEARANRLEVTCRLEPEGTARPAELLTALLELDPQAVAATKIVRVGWVLA